MSLSPIRRTLRRDRLLVAVPALRWLAGGQLVSGLGTQVTAIALPTYAILTLHASGTAIGLLTAVGYLGPLVVGLPAGVWVENRKRVPILIGSDGVRLVLVGSVALLGSVSKAPMWQLCAVAALVAAAGVFYDTGTQALLPEVLTSEQRAEGSAALATARGIAAVGGPPLGGMLVALVGAAAAITADAASYAVSIVAALLMLRYLVGERSVSVPSAKASRSADGADGSSWSRLREGVGFVRHHPVLKRVTGYIALVNFGGGIVSAAFYLYLYESLRLSPREAGTALAIGNLGILFGVAVGRRLARTTRPVGIWALAFAGPSAFWILPLAPSGGAALVFVAAYQLLFFLGGYGFFIYHTTLRQQVTAEGQQARAFSVISTVGLGTLPLGALAGGFLNSELSYRATVVVGAAIATAGATLAFGLPSLAAFQARRSAESASTTANATETADSRT